MTTSVKVYRNLHNSKLSVKNDLVMGHCDQILLKRPTFKVNQKGILRIRHSKKKEVCAVVEGLPVDFTNYVPFRDRSLHFLISPVNLSNALTLYFNPYFNNHFVDEQDNPVKNADYASIQKDGTILAIGVTYHA